MTIPSILRAAADITDEEIRELAQHRRTANRALQGASRVIRRENRERCASILAALRGAADEVEGR